MDLYELVDRTSELAALEESWAQAVAGRAQLVVVWGRRRVGKTFLLLHVLQSLPSGVRRIYHEATTQAPPVELQRFFESVRLGLGTDSMAAAGGGFASWESALELLAFASLEEPIAVVLDEASYVARATPDFPSIVQAVWDKLVRSGRPNKLWLVLSGSAVGAMEDLLGPRGALHRRATLELRMQPVDLLGAAGFLPELEATQVIEAYAACGGYPLHLKAWDASLSTDENLARLAFTSGGLLLEDAEATFRQELAGSPGYHNVLAAVGRGRTRFGEIQNDAHQRIERALEVLLQARFVRRSTPIGAPRRAAPIYEISDPYLRFWFSTLYGWVEQIDGGHGIAVQGNRREEWVKHVAWVFEEAARAHAGRLVQRGELPRDLVVGRWWSQSGGQAEIDVVGLRGGMAVMLGDAKWSEHPAGLADLRRLIGAARRLPDLTSEPLYRFWRRTSPASRIPGQGTGYGPADMLRI